MTSLATWGAGSLGLGIVLIAAVGLIESLNQFEVGAGLLAAALIAAGAALVLAHLAQSRPILAAALLLLAAVLIVLIALVYTLLFAASDGDGSWAPQVAIVAPLMIGVAIALCWIALRLFSAR